MAETATPRIIQTGQDSGEARLLQEVGLLNTVALLQIL